MEIINGPTEVVGVDQIQPHPRNARQGDVGAIHESIASNGFYGAVVAQRSTGYILAGNHRWMAACAAGASEIPVTWVDVDDDRALRILLADNRTNDIASYDDNALADLLTELAQTPLGLDGTGFDGDALDELLADLGREDTTQSADPAPQIDRAAELQEVWGTERGQIWAIPSKTVPGKSHRLMCGDSTSAEDVERLMGGEKAGLVFTDPPYGIRFQSGMSRGGTATRFARLANDDVILDVAPVVEALMGDDTAAFVWTGQQVYPEWRQQFDAIYKSTIIWHKPGGGIGDLDGDYAADYEMCLFCTKGRPKFRGKRGMAVWTVGKDGVSDYVHPTQKPVELSQRAMRDFSDAGTVVVDLFGGSGSTFVGSENERRVCYGMEIDPGYVAVILQRMTDMGLSPHRVTRDEDDG